MKKSRFALFVAVFAVFACILPCYSQTIDQQLQINDYYTAQHFSQFPRDARYNNIMLPVASKLNSVIVKTFGVDKDFNFYACTSQVGFNAVSFHRFIVFDSLLLDSLRFLAKGVAYYNGVNNDYVNLLAVRVAQISKAHQTGMLNANYNNQLNPFGLPDVGPLNNRQQKRAEKLFIEMLASWMAHEGSHCMRDHMKYRIQAMQKNYAMDPGGDRQQFMSNMNQYMNAKISQDLEKDADICAVTWLMNAGYGVEGFVAWLKFGEKLERVMGTENAYIRTHPKSSERIKYIQDRVRVLKGR